MRARRPLVLVVVGALSVACTIRAPSETEAPPTRFGPDPSPTASSQTPGASPSLGTATPEPTAAPTPSPDVGALDLRAIGCEGGVVLEWSPSTHPSFDHYIALRSPRRAIAPDYPPIAPAVDWGDTFATDRFVTSAVDASIIPSETLWNYRVMAYDAAGAVVSASPVRSARLSEVASLGELTVSTDADGMTHVAWSAYRGFSGCFTAYHLLDGTTVLNVINGQATATFATDALRPGAHELRIEAVRDTTLGSFVVARSEPTPYTAP